MGNSTQTTYISDINGSPGIPQKIMVRLPKIIGNLLIYLFYFGVFYFIKYQTLALNSNYISYLQIYLLAWAVGGLISGKFRFKSVTTMQSFLKRSYTSLLISLGIIAFLLNIFNSLSISRFVVIGSLSTALIFEVALFSLTNKTRLKDRSGKKKRISVVAPLIDLTILSIVLALYFRYKFNLGHLDESHLILLSGSYLSWLLAAFITHQFKPFSEKSDVWNAISIQLKFYLLIFALMSFIVYFLQIDQSYRIFYLQGLIIYSVVSFFVMLFLYIDKLPQKTDDLTADFIHAFEIKTPKISDEENEIIDTKYKLSDSIVKKSQLRDRLKSIYLKHLPELYSFLERKLDLDGLEKDKSFVVKSRDPYNVDVFPKEYLELFINLHRINDIRRINEYFIKVNKRLSNGGVFVGNFEPIRFRYDRFRNKYPFLVANTFYFWDFLWKRVTPKLPIFRKIYFVFSKGEDRALPLAEGLGRLYYCGFEIVDLKLMDNLCYFVAKKTGIPSTDKYPSYSPIIKMKRQGKEGKPVYVYKLRTMHPYSEYIQDFIYNHNSLQPGGKFNNDFRITKWGVVFRKMWIDEMPMITNLLKGDLKLVGVRPISKQYLGLYDEEFRKRRTQYKPGLVPPYYADLPNGLEEIIESEKKYLDEYDKNRFKTDFKYFFKAFNNIALNDKRSG